MLITKTILDKMGKKILLFLFIILIVIVITTLIFLYFNFNSKQEKSSYVMPKIIWTFWDNPELPTLINLIKENNDMKLKGWEIIYLNELNIDKYISKDKYPDNFNTLGIQHKADWIRLYLLSKYGGTWLDASIIINDNKALDKLYNDSINSKSQFTGFNFKNYEPGAFSNKGVPLYVENWFIMVPINSIVIKLWLIQYERAIQMGFQNYRKILDNEQIDTSKIFSKSSDVYLTQHGCLQHVFQKQLDFSSIPTIILPAENDMFKISVGCNFDNACTMNKIKNRLDEVYDVPYIKLVNGARKTGIDISDYFQR